MQYSKITIFKRFDLVYFEEYFKVTAKLIVDYDHAIDLKITKLKSIENILN